MFPLKGIRNLRGLYEQADCRSLTGVRKGSAKTSGSAGSPTDELVEPFALDPRTTAFSRPGLVAQAMGPVDARSTAAFRVTPAIARASVCARLGAPGAAREVGERRPA
jgi:hypothetical protein